MSAMGGKLTLVPADWLGDFPVHYFGIATELSIIRLALARCWSSNNPARQCVVVQ